MQDLLDYVDGLDKQCDKEDARMSCLQTTFRIADKCFPAVASPDVITGQYGLHDTLNEARESLAALLGRVLSLSDTSEKKLLMQRCGRVGSRLDALCARARRTAHMMSKACLPIDLYTIGDALVSGDARFDLKKLFVSRNMTTSARANPKRGGVISYGYYYTFEDACCKDESILPYVYVALVQDVDVTTGEKGKVRVHATKKVDNDPNRIAGVNVQDAAWAYLIVKKALVPLELADSTSYVRGPVINEQLLDRKWPSVTYKGSALEFIFNMLLWPQYFEADDGLYRPTEKLHQDLLADVKQATGLTDDKIRYNTEMKSPFCTVHFALEI